MYIGSLWDAQIKKVKNKGTGQISTKKLLHEGSLLHESKKKKLTQPSDRKNCLAVIEKKLIRIINQKKRQESKIS